MADGKWDKKTLTGFQLSGKVLAVLGMGNIGKAVAQRALAFGMKVITLKRGQSNLPKNVLPVGSLKEMLSTCDILTIHLPFSKQTENIIAKKELSLMKSSSILINNARGGIVNEEDLLEAITAGKIGGAGLDTFKDEMQPFSSTVLQLVNHSNVICTPHLGGSTFEAGDMVMSEVCRSVKDALEGKIPSFETIVV